MRQELDDLLCARYPDLFCDRQASPFEVVWAWIHLRRWLIRAHRQFVRCDFSQYKIRRLTASRCQASQRKTGKAALPR